MKTILFTLIFGVVTNAAYAQAPNHKKSPAPQESPHVEILIQPESPLRIAKVETKWVLPDHSGIELFLVVENVSSKTVSAYATRDDGANTGHCLAFSAKSPGKALRPQQSEGRARGKFITQHRLRGVWWTLWSSLMARHGVLMSARLQII